jgi:DNA-binding MurR/RpiR family transcriptional regulator
MATSLSFESRFAEKVSELRPAEARVASYLQDHPEEALLASAAVLAHKTKTSDATVIRTARALGYGGLDELRRDIAGQLRSSLSPAARLTRTLSGVGSDIAQAFNATIETHITSLDALRRDISEKQFCRVIDWLVAAERTFIFGIGPSSAMADYFALQLGRLGVEAQCMTDTGLLLADKINQLRDGDLLILLAYGRLYAEVETLLGQAKRLKLPTILLTDSLADELRGRVSEVLKVARGRAEMMSLHTATLGLIEAMIVGYAAKRPSESLTSLKKLDEFRANLSGRRMDVSPR